MESFEQYKEEGLRIVDESNVSFESNEQNELHHQEMIDLHINYVEELAIERYFKEVQEPQDYVFGVVHPYGRPY